MAIFKLRYLLIFILLALLVVVGVILMGFFTKKKEATEIIDSYIVEKGYENHIQEKEILYDWKQGTYYAKVIFEDEPENYYEIYLENNSNNVYVIGYNDQKGEEITNKKEGKYIDN
jgi:hypothetical protein